MTDALAACPCGKVPTSLHIKLSGEGYKYAIASPDCCGDWLIEFRADYLPFDSEECQRRAREEWNAAPRSET